MNNDQRQNIADWYAPLNDSRSGRDEAASEKKRRGLPGAWRAVLWTLVLVGLITGSSLFFSDGAEPVAAQNGKDKPSFNVELPEQPLQPDDQMPETWQEFFDSYFVTEDSSGKGSRVPMVEQRPKWRMRLSEPDAQEKTLEEVYQTCFPSIVGITSSAKGRMGNYWGTGIILSEDGLILTNAHLIEDCDSATVSFPDGTSYPALLVGADTASDIAVLKIEASGLTPAAFGDSDRLIVGQHVAAIGNPLGEEYRATMTDGIISGVNRDVRYSGRTLTLIQTNTAINEGNSGGALVNMYGQVIGVTNMKIMSNYSSIEGIGFAIPSTTICAIVNALIEDGEVRGRTAIGITVGAIGDEAAEYYKLPIGLYVSVVSENSDAYAKGIREGDIITAVNGEPARSTDDIVRVKDSLQVGDTITFTVWRAGESFDVDVTLIEYNDIY